MHTSTAHSHHHAGRGAAAAASAASAGKSKLHNPRHPERTLLHQTIADHFEAWFELASTGQFDGQGDHHSPVTWDTLTSLWQVRRRGAPVKHPREPRACRRARCSRTTASVKQPISAGFNGGSKAAVPLAHLKGQSDVPSLCASSVTRLGVTNVATKMGRTKPASGELCPSAAS
jgi:hypothetical protein